MLLELFLRTWHETDEVSGLDDQLVVGGDREVVRGSSDELPAAR
jgi:hypothetical protein